MHPRDEMKMLAEAIDVIGKVQNMPEVKASRLMMDVCRDLELDWFRRHREVQSKFSRKPKKGT